MPQFTGSVTVNDGSATPVAVAYAPELLSSSSTVLVDRREATREMQPTITINFDRPTSTRKTFKVKHAIALPIKQTVSGVDVLAGIARANVEFIIPQTASLQIRKDLRAALANLEDLPIIKAGIEDLDPLY